MDALGRDRVRAVMMPSRYNADISLQDAREMAGILRVRYDEIPIEGRDEWLAAARRLAAVIEGSRVFMVVFSTGGQGDSIEILGLGHLTIRGAGTMLCSKRFVKQSTLKAGEARRLESEAGHELPSLARRSQSFCFARYDTDRIAGL